VRFPGGGLGRLEAARYSACPDILPTPSYDAPFGHERGYCHVEVEPSRVSVITVNRPFAGLDRVMTAETCVTVPLAQSGMQLSMPEVPLPVAPAEVHDTQSMAVTTLPPSPLKAISDGSIPVYVPMATTGNCAVVPAVGVVDGPVALAGGDVPVAEAGGEAA
jgi:hypothetical protein